MTIVDSQPPALETGPSAEPGSPSKMRTGGPGLRRYAAVILAAVALGAGTVLVAPRVVSRFQPHLYAGTVLQGSEPAPSLDGLVYTSGSPVDMAALKGDVAVIFFGYTNCPDECPAVMSALARATGRLTPAQTARTHVMMVTIDAAHDDATTLEHYVTAFNPAFAGVRGPEDVTARVSSLYGVYFQPDALEADAPHPDATGATSTTATSISTSTSTSGGVSTITHTTSLVGIGKDGTLRVVWPPNVTDAALAADMAALLDA